MVRARKTQTGKHGTAPTESRVSVFVTVGWMLGAMATFGAEAGGFALQAIAWSADPTPEWMEAIASVLFLVALVCGVFTLVLTPICLKVRPSPPPKSITRMVVVVATVPMMVLVARALAG